MKLRFIVNEKSGNGNGITIWSKLKEELTLPYEAFITTYEKEAIQLAESIKREAEQSGEVTLLVGIGGDGTYFEIMNGVGICEHIILGAVCAGSGNDFKRAYMEFKNAVEIEQFLQHGQVEKYDLGYLTAGNQQFYFVNNSGIGFDATVAITANESKVKKKLNRFGLGKLSYVYYLIACLFTYKPFSMEVTVNGEKKKYNNVWFVTASNQPFFGGGMKISPKSKTNDGMLELTIVHNLNKYKLLFVFSTVFFGKHTNFKEIEQISAQQFRIQMNETYLMHADGEKLPIDSATEEIVFSVEKNCMSLAKKNE